MIAFLQIIAQLPADLDRLFALSASPRQPIDTANILRCREPALVQECGMRSKRGDAATRLSFALLSRLFDWRDTLEVVRPETMIRWQQAGGRLFWRSNSRPGRPRSLWRYADSSGTWQMGTRCGGEKRIDNELLLKLALRVPPRTVRMDMLKPSPDRLRGDQRWATFLRNYAKAIGASNFFVGVTANFRLLFIIAAIYRGSRRLLHLNVTGHRTAAWTLQQLQEALGFKRACCYLLDDRDSIFAGCLDESIKHLGLTVLKSPPHSPTANAICERVIGTICREYLDWLIPFSEPHLRSMPKEWVTHCDGTRPHMPSGPGVPDPPMESVLRAKEKSRHLLGARVVVGARSVVGGLHHDYSLAAALARRITCGAQQYQWGAVFAVLIVRLNQHFPQHS